MTQFTYEEWHLLWKAVEAQATRYWALVERFQIATKETGNDETELWLHFLQLAEEQTQLLDKVENVANEQFPIVYETLFPAKPKENEIYPNEKIVDLDELRLDQEIEREENKHQ